MRLLIIGANGQLGKEWVEFCKKRSISFTEYDLPELDITKTDQLEEVLDREHPNVLINCAAYTKVDQAETDRELADQINHKAVANLADACKDRNIKLVHYSTDYVFAGEASDRESNPEGYPEDHPTAPTNVYGVTKRDGEEVIRSSECDYLILRISWLCGVYGPNFVKTMLRLGGERDELSVVDDQFGSPTFTKNVVEWTWELLQKQVDGIVHLSSSGITNWYTFAKKIFELKGLQVTVNPVDSTAYKTAATRPAFSKLNTGKFSEIVGYQPISWQEGLATLIEEIAEHEDH